MFPASNAMDKSPQMTDGLEASSQPVILAASGRAIIHKGHTRNQTPGSLQNSHCRVDLESEKQGKETDSPRPDRCILGLPSISK
jgi:hypothetical protein